MKSSTSRFIYKILYDDGTPYDLNGGMVRQRGSNLFYWVEDTSLPLSDTYDAPLVTFEEIIIDEVSYAGNSLYFEPEDDTFGVSSSKQLDLWEFNSTIQFKVGVQYPNSEEKEYLYF